MSRTRITGGASCVRKHTCPPESLSLCPSVPLFLCFLLIGWLGACPATVEYSAVLWRRLMGQAGQRVMNITTDSSDATLRAYGHCANATAATGTPLSERPGAGAGSKGSVAGDLALVLINLLNSTKVVSLSSGVLPTSLQSKGTAVTRTDYVLTPGKPVGGWETCCIGHTGLLDETKTHGPRLGISAGPCLSGATRLRGILFQSQDSQFRFQDL